MSITDPHFLEIKRIFENLVPILKDMGATVEAIDAEHVEMRIPYDESCVGDPDSGALHTAFITKIIDTGFGAAVMARLGRKLPIATIDLRVDYLAASRRDTDLLVETRCYRLARDLAFVSGRAYHQDPAVELAAATGTFIVSQSSRPDRSILEPRP